MRIKRFLLLIAILVVVILLYKFPFDNTSSIQENGKSELIDEVIVSTTPESPEKENSEINANLTALGDLISIDFVLKLKDGTVIDTNDEILAKENNIQDYVKGPFKLILGQSGKLRFKSFDKVLVGWKVGEQRTVEIAPTESELFIKFNRTKSEKLYFAIPRYQRLPLKSFVKLFGKQAKIGETVSNPNFPWAFKISNITENSVVGDPVVEVGKKYDLAGKTWPVELVSIKERMLQFKQAPEKDSYEVNFGTANVLVQDSYLFIRYDPIENKIVDHDIDSGPVKMPAKFRIIDITDSQFTLFRIDNLNDKYLDLTAKILDRIPDVKEVSEDSPLEKASQTFR